MAHHNGGHNGRARLRDTAVYALTRTGAELGRSLASRLGATLYVPEKLQDISPNTFQSLPLMVRESFGYYKRHVFVCATGIVVRAIAGLLQDKGKDPAVVVMDQDGRFAVSLLAGHIGGANDLARECAAISGGDAVITTATDTAGVLAIDVVARDLHMAIEDLNAVKHVSSALLDGRVVQLHDPEGWLEEYAGRANGTGGLSHFHYVHDLSEWHFDTPGVVVSHVSDPGGESVICDHENVVVLRPPCLMVGVGCKRGTDAAIILERVRAVLAENGLAEASVRKLGTVTDKRDEPGMVQAAIELEVELVPFDAQDLAAVDVPNPSQKPLDAVGTPSVAEAAALLLSGNPAGVLLVEKAAGNGVTVAIARREKA